MIDSSSIPANWNQLTDPIKKSIIGWLDYETRCSLRTCSKSEKSLIDSTEFRASVVKIEHTECSRVADKTIIRIDIDTFSIWFIGKNDVTRVDRGWNGDVATEHSEVKQENRHELAKKFLDRFFRKWPVSTDLFHVEGFDIEPHEDWLFKCSSLELRYLSHGNSFIWMDNLISQNKYKSIVVMGKSPYDDIVVKLPVPSKILNVTECLRIGYCLLITDEQFERIEATDLDVTVINVSKESIRKKLREFLEKGKRNHRFEINSIYPKEFKMKELLPEDVEVKKRSAEYFLEKYDINLKFKNAHGVQETRQFTVDDMQDYKGVQCYVKDKFDHESRYWE